MSVHSSILDLVGDTPIIDVSQTSPNSRVRIYAKLGCKSAVELTRIAVRTGLIEA